MSKSGSNEVDESQTETISTPIEFGFFSGPGIVNELVPFREVDGLAVTEGDIILGTITDLRNPDPNVLEQNEDQRVRTPEINISEGLILQGNRYRWPNKTMPYEIDSNLPNQSRIQQAMEHITSKTGFKFVRRTNQDDYVYFQWHPSNANSQLGKRGRKQIINLADWAKVGNTIHEILHAMGVYHEAGRSDRDNYIRIHWTNLADGWASQYAKPLGALSIATYDYCSIMHYSPTGGAKHGLQAFTVLKQTSCNVGQRQGLSTKDIETIKTMYP
jgi:hypothetical protein